MEWIEQYSSTQEENKTKTENYFRKNAGGKWKYWSDWSVNKSFTNLPK